MNLIQEKSLNVVGMNGISIYFQPHDGKFMILLKIMVVIQLQGKLLQQKIDKLRYKQLNTDKQK